MFGFSIGGAASGRCPPRLLGSWALALTVMAGCYNRWTPSTYYCTPQQPACPSGLTCQSGQCLPLPPPCSSAAACDDQLACTADLCAAEGCQHLVLEGSCLIEGVCQAADWINWNNLCQQCRPRQNSHGWSQLEGKPSPLPAAIPADSFATTEGPALVYFDDRLLMFYPQVEGEMQPIVEAEKTCGVWQSGRKVHYDPGGGLPLDRATSVDEVNAVSYTRVLPPGRRESGVMVFYRDAADSDRVSFIMRPRGSVWAPPVPVDDAYSPSVPAGTMHGWDEAPEHPVLTLAYLGVNKSQLMILRATSANLPFKWTEVNTDQLLGITEGPLFARGVALISFNKRLLVFATGLFNHFVYRAVLANNQALSPRWEAGPIHDVAAETTARSNLAPAVAIHNGQLYLAIKTFDDDGLRLWRSMDGQQWRYLGPIAGVSTLQRPALTSAGPYLYLGFKSASQDRACIGWLELVNPSGNDAPSQRWHSVAEGVCAP